MSANSNKALIERAFAGTAKGDPTDFVGLFGDDIVWIVEGTSKWSGRWEGLATVQGELVPRLFSRFATPYYNYADQIIAEDDMVVARVRGETTTHRGDAYDNSYCFVIRMKDGKIVELREYMDTALAERVLGDPDIAMEPEG